MNASTIAAQLYTIRDFTKTAEDFRQSLLKIKEIGYASVQVSAIGPIAPEQVKAIADETGLTICATHTSFDRLNNDLDRVVAEHKLWDCRYVGLGSMPAAYRSSLDGYRQFVKEAGVIAAKLGEQGLQLVYHNHKFEFARLDGKRTGMDVLFDETDAKDFGFELDLYWVHAGGAHAADWVRKVQGRMAVVHLKDMAIFDDQQDTAEIGEGNMNYAELVQACRDTGVEWYVVEQDNCRRDPFESLAISHRSLRQYL